MCLLYQQTMADLIATPPVTFADIEAAAGRLEGIAHRTPVMTSRTADVMSDGKLFFKCENLQRGAPSSFAARITRLQR